MEMKTFSIDRNTNTKDNSKDNSKENTKEKSKENTTTRAKQPKSVTGKADKEAIKAKKRAQRAAKADKKARAKLNAAAKAAKKDSFFDKFHKLPYINLYFLIVFAALILTIILVSYFVLSVPIAEICTLVILEAILASVLNRVPIWIHGLIIVVQAACGYFLSKPVFAVLMLAVYIMSMILLFLWRDEE